MKYFYFSLFIALIFISCGSRQDTERLQKLIGSKIALPTGLRSKVMERDTAISVYDTLSPVKVLVYYNAEGCTPCKLKELLEWRGMKTDSIYLPNKNIRFIYILNTHNISSKEVGWTLAGFRFEHPVFLDPAGSFERMNPGLPVNPLFHTFLLDRNNRVVLVGSPIGNPKMWELYKSTIARLVAGGGTLTDPEITKK